MVEVASGHLRAAALWTQTKSTDGLSDIATPWLAGMLGLRSGSAATKCRFGHHRPAGPVAVGAVAVAADSLVVAVGEGLCVFLAWMMALCTRRAPNRIGRPH